MSTGASGREGSVGLRDDGPREDVTRSGGPSLPGVGVLIPVLDAQRTIRDCLRGVRRAASAYPGPVEICVGDNGSTDGTFEYLHERSESRLEVFRDARATVAGLRNEAAARTRGSVLVCLDADCVPAPDHITRVVEVLTSRKCDATGYRVEPSDEAGWLERTWHELHRRRDPTQFTYVNSGNFAILRGAFDAVGGFDASLVTGEDADICRRLKARGYSLCPDPRLRVKHHGGPPDAAAFYRQQLWHATGSGALDRGLPFDLPTLGALGYLACLLLATGTLLFGAWGLVSRMLGALAITSSVPIATVVYRLWGGGRPEAAPCGVILYHLYFLARGHALLRQLSSVRSRVRIV